MNDVLRYLDDREQEFARHVSVARMLEARVDQAASDDWMRVEIRHVNTVKSGLLIHIYNIVEAVTTRTLATVGETVVTERPGGWTGLVLKEWVRAQIWGGEERIGEGALTRLAQVSGLLASGDNLAPFIVKGEPGSWDDKAIKKVAERLGCQLVLTPAVSQAVYETVFRDDRTAMADLARRRNAIAHGASTFEDGANDLTLEDLENLAARVIPFLRAVARSYETFLGDKKYLSNLEAAA